MIVIQKCDSNGVASLNYKCIIILRRFMIVIQKGSLDDMASVHWSI